MTTKKKSVGFRLGQVVATAGVAEKMRNDSAYALFCGASFGRHNNGDWGDLTDGDRKQNEDALIHGDRILSVYDNPDGTLWIITESDRSVTTLLFPDEY